MKGLARLCWLKAFRLVLCKIQYYSFLLQQFQVATPSKELQVMIIWGAVTTSTIFTWGSSPLEVTTITITNLTITTQVNILPCQRNLIKKTFLNETNKSIDSFHQTFPNMVVQKGQNLTIKANFQCEKSFKSIFI